MWDPVKANGQWSTLTGSSGPDMGLSGPGLGRIWACGPGLGRAGPTTWRAVAWPRRCLGCLRARVHGAWSIMDRRSGARWISIGFMVDRAHAFLSVSLAHVEQVHVCGPSSFPFTLFEHGGPARRLKASSSFGYHDQGLGLVAVGSSWPTYARRRHGHGGWRRRGVSGQFKGQQHPVLYQKVAEDPKRGGAGDQDTRWSPHNAMEHGGAAGRFGARVSRR